MDDDQRHSARTATVRGIGTARVRPDGIVVGLGVLHRSEAAAEALSETAGKAQKLKSLFRELEIDEEDWVAGSTTLREREEWDESSRREVLQGYVASSRVDVRLGDTSRLGTLLAEAAERVEASVDGPRWGSRPRTRLTMRLEAERWRTRVGERERTRGRQALASVMFWRSLRWAPSKPGVECTRRTAPR
jgi:Protein of unknown function (DUF541)